MTDKPTDNVVPFQARSGSEMDDLEVEAQAEPDAVMATLANVMDLQQSFEGQMKLAIGIIGELQAHVRDLEHDVARLKTAQAKKPAILNAQGARAN